jgi:hypothetical protein
MGSPFNFSADWPAIQVPTRLGFTRVGIDVHRVHDGATGAVGLIVGAEYVSVDIKELSRAVKAAKRILRNAGGR